jgi:hypothetical protein
MKKLFFLLLLVQGLGTVGSAQSIAINNDGSAPNASAMLDIKSTTKGILTPRMTSAERTAITGVKGLMVFDITTNSFWFHNGSAWMELGTGGVSPWTLNGTHIHNSNAGNVGIGNAAPAYDLHIFRNDPSIGFYDVDDNHTSGYIIGDSSNLVINAYRRSQTASNEPGNLLLQVGSTRFPGTVAGNVGIGITDPSYKVSLDGDMGLYDGNDFIGFLGNEGENFMINAKLGNTLIGGASPRNLILQYGVGSFALSGRVGIGTNAPFGKLTVSGSGELFRAGNATTAIHMTDDYIQFIGNSAGKYFMQLVGNNLTIGNSTGNNSGNLFIWGNQVAIGTTNPAAGYKLSVGGKAICEELKVQLTGNWPDYVFEKQYKLPTLENLEKFIQQNRHLPNIPPAREIEADGINVGDMQKRMMEKIEELTLYIIDLKKQIDDLKIKTGN